MKMRWEFLKSMECLQSHTVMLMAQGAGKRLSVVWEKVPVESKIDLLNSWLVLLVLTALAHVDFEKRVVSVFSKSKVVSYCPNLTVVMASVVCWFPSHAARMTVWS